MDTTRYMPAILLVALCALAASAMPQRDLRTLISSLSDPQQQQQQSEQTTTPTSAPANNNQQVVSVHTSSGQLDGVKQSLNNLGNASVYKFLAVPYAEAPTGALRFQRPVELNKTRALNRVDASKYGKTCPQFRHLTRFISPLLNIDNEHQTSEDCLHLNVFVPSSVGHIEKVENVLEPSKQLPVIVWIPGEGFDFADARQFDGSYLAHKTQSIVVTVQYRVGVLGFLQAPALGIKGNMGIYDQLMALRWVKRNIAAFGGDSERVALMGRFSGSMSISAIITAPKQELLKLDGQPLFNRAALVSGVAVGDWIIESDQEERVKKVVELAVARGYCKANDGSCLKNLPVDQLLPISGYGWRLVRDDELIGELAPSDAIIANQFSDQLEGVMIGETGMEGTLCLYRHMLSTHSSNFAQLIEEDKLTKNDVYNIIQDDSITYFKYNLSQQNPIQVALESLIEDSQTDSLESSDSRLRDRYLNACSSYMVKSHSNRFKRNILARNQLEETRMDSSKKPVAVFHYELRYKPSFSLAPDYIKTAAHGDDIPLIFGLVYSQPRRDLNESDLLVSRKMMAYVGNFVHGNNPLLNQHSTIESSLKNGENETTSMDEHDSGVSDANQQASVVRRSWSSESQVYPVEFMESDAREISRAPQGLSLEGNSPATGLDGRQSKFHSLRVVVVARPLWMSREPLGGQSIDIVEQSHKNGPQTIEDSSNAHFLVASQQSSENPPTTRSQHLLELHRLRQLQSIFDTDNSLWFQHSASSRRGHIGASVAPLQVASSHLLATQPPMQQQQPQVAQQSAMNLINESSFMTMLLFSSCIVIFAMMSFCLGLCLIVFRYNLTSVSDKNRKQQFAQSSSSCNICDDSQGGSIDAVLSGNRKDSNRGFCNVFAKLRHPSHSISHNQLQCTSSASNRHHHTAQNPSDIVLHTARPTAVDSSSASQGQ